MMMFRLIGCVGLAVLMANVWGVTGLAAGLVIPVTLTSFSIIPWFAAKRVKLKLISILKTLISPFLISIFIACVGKSIYCIWVPINISTLVIECSVLFLIFIVLCLKWGVDNETRKTIKERIAFS